MKYLLSSRSTACMPGTSYACKYYYNEENNSIICDYSSGYTCKPGYNVNVKIVLRLLHGTYLFEKATDIDKNADKIVENKILKDSL